MKHLRLLALLALAQPAIASYTPPLEYGVAQTITFDLYNTDGTLDVDEVDGGAEVTLYCDEAAGATATNDFVDEGPYYSLALTATELQCARLVVSIGATDTNNIHIWTIGSASAQVDDDGGWYDAIPTVPADMVSVSGDSTAADNAEAFFDGTGYAGTGNTIPNVTNLTNLPTIPSDWITAAGIATDAIGAAEIAANAIGASEVADGAIDAGAIATDAITAAKIAADAIGASEIAAGAVGASELATDAIGADELAASALAEINAEADTALSDYDPPTRAELTSDIAGLNDLSAAEVNAEVDTAIETYHLDHLLGVDYDPATPPGVSTALLNELIESDGGVSRFTANALEQGPSGGGGSSPDLLQTTTIATLASQTDFTLTAGSPDDDAYTDRAMVVVTDQSTGTQKAVGWINNYVGSTRTVTLREDPGVFTMAVGDTVDIIAAISAADVQYWLGTVPTALESAVDIRTEIDSNSTQLAAIVADTNELQTDDVPGLIAALNDLSAAEVNSEVDTAIETYHLDHLLGVDYDPATPPGVSTALLNELIESDAGVSRFTSNALENAPGGGGGSADWTTGEREEIRGRLGITGTTSAGGNTPTLALQASVAGLNDLSAADVNAQVDAALADYDGPTDTEMDTAFAALNDLDAAGVRSAIGLSAANLDTQLAALPTAAEVRDALLNYTVDGSISVACYFALDLAYSSGKWTTSGSVVTYRDPTDAANRIVGTIGASSFDSITRTCP